MNATKTSWREYGWVAFCLIALAAVGLVEVKYVDYLRKQHQIQAPEHWRTLPFNGSSNYLVPWVLGENELYAAKVNQIRLHGIPCDPFIQENRGFSSWIPNAVTFYAIALMSLPFDRIQTAWVTIQYVMLLLWFLMLYGLFRKLIPSPRVVFPVYLLAALIPLCLFNGFIGLSVDMSCPNPGKWAWLLLNVGHAKLRAIEFLRMTSPLITQFFMIAWMTLIMLYLATLRRSFFFSLLIGLLGGGLVLVHYFEWSYAMASLGILFSVTLIRPEWREFRGSVATLFAAACVMSMVFLKAITSEVDVSVLARTGIEHVRRFDKSSIILLIFGMGAVYRASFRATRPAQVFWLMIGSALLAGFCAINLSLVTGVYLQNFLYYRCANFFLSLAFSAWIIEKAEKGDWLNRNAKAAIVLVLAVTLFNAKSFAEKHYQICALPAAWEQGFEWLRQNAPKDGKVLSLSPFVTRLLPVYTPVKLQVSDGFPVNSKMPTGKNLEKMAIMLKTLSVDPERFLSDWSNDATKIQQAWISGECNLAEIDRCWPIVLGHASFDQSTFPKIILSDYAEVQPLRESFYVWVNRWEKPWFTVPPEKRAGWEEVYRNQDVEIYFSK